MAGDYEYDSYTIDKNGVTLSGPTPGDPARLSNDCGGVLTISGASGVTVSICPCCRLTEAVEDSYCYSSPVARRLLKAARLTLRSSTFEIAGGYIGVAFRYDSVGNTLNNSNVHDNDWAGVVDLGSGTEKPIKATLSTTTDTASVSATDPTVKQLFIVFRGSGVVRLQQHDMRHHYSGDQGGPFTIGPDNDIHDNSDGIYIEGNVAQRAHQRQQHMTMWPSLRVCTWWTPPTGLDATKIAGARPAVRIRKFTTPGTGDGLHRRVFAVRQFPSVLHG